ncbi:hypothetical protein P154DRAFT_327708 [Amniculicola lignicola CBS 123094]|uniref:R3H domain-containing protein n=1 Tax=Amniculicola lignicola CBS 123094 TaxID=1392246 RepID=A0A6A5W7G4_9PLEO|nr:hypothetical protein P154DRAFT_327708 [Amniculicola lignicola CBS 123094]
MASTATTTTTATAAPSSDSTPTGPSNPGESQRRRRPRTRKPGGTSSEAPQDDPTPTSARGGRRGRGGGRGNHTGGGVSLRPEPPSAPEASTQSIEGENAAPNPAGAPSRGRGSGSGSGRGRGGRGQGPAQNGGQHQQAQGPQNSAARGRGGASNAPRPPPRMAGGRQFGGQLTADNDCELVDGDAGRKPKAAGALKPDAPEFRPGQAVAPRKPRPPREKKPQAPKSNAPDIATRTHEDIDNGHYECAICTEEVRRNGRAWSCRTCWTVFHLGCIKKWSTNEGSVAARQQALDGELPPPRQWRCPGCNLPKDTLPKSFSCWCEKEVDPRPLAGLPPFSCGQTCARPRDLLKPCAHPCPSVCHAGPCPKCTHTGPTQFCFCGKKSVTRRCVDTNYDGWSCGEVCDKLMPCGEHFCEKPCHQGPCGDCEVRVPARCYCGQVQREILCCDRGDEQESSQCHMAADGSKTVEQWTGRFECANTCSRTFDCGKHQCEKPCHKQEAQIPHCPKSPNVVSHCPCGKTSLTEINDQVRQTCEDPIPNCSRPCKKALGCGHECQKYCHQGECPPCLQTMSISCRCGRTTSSTICHQGMIEPPQCMRICRVSLNCGRHECGEHCCSGERKAGERQSNRRKPRPLDSAPRSRDEGFEAEHICTRSCGRPLKCGNPDHRCEELCHKGACGTCRDAIFEEVSCNCGRTVLQPPLPCGTKPPPCRYPCERPKSCGHAQTAHSCHQDTESCPKCPFLTAKPCMCGKNTLKNQPCWFSEVRCGEICGRTLRCGAHKCQKQCHRPGECDEPCKQPCGKELSVCGHPDMASCHSPTACKEEKSCQQKILVTCECQRIKQEAKCNASKTSDGNLKKMLKCDDECARLERNRKLALALNIDASTHQDDHIPYSDATLSMYQENSTWAATQEKMFRLFAADPAEKRLRFKPMASHQRAFVHSIAEDFGFDSESMDPEPHRHVSVFKTPRFVMAPMKSLAECARVRQVQRVVHNTAATAARPKPIQLSGDPFNAFLITNPRFALTVEEVNAVVRSALPKAPFPLEPALSLAITSKGLGKLQLARFDSSLNILRKESDIGPGAGWSQVAAKGVPGRKAEKGMMFGSKNGFTVLSLSTKKKKEKKAEVVDDWEAAEMEEEEKERTSGAASGVSSGDEGHVGEGEGAAPHYAAGSLASRFIVDTSTLKADAEVLKSPSGGRWADMSDDE